MKQKYAKRLNHCNNFKILYYKKSNSILIISRSLQHSLQRCAKNLIELKEIGNDIYCIFYDHIIIFDR